MATTTVTMVETTAEQDTVGNSEHEPVYVSTANPHNAENIDLHKRRFRAAEQRDAEYFRELYEKDGWRDEDHMHLDEMPVSRFHMDGPSQRVIHEVQRILVDLPYNEFGKTEGSWENYTLMFRNGWSSAGDQRKPVTEVFQQYCEEIYRPLMFSLLFGDAWEEIKDHWGTFKSCTIKVCEGDVNFLGENIFHMHIDGKVGLMQKKNYSQRHMHRLLFSIVTDALDDMDNVGATKYGTTVYPIWQPRKGFKSNHELHSYMQSKYSECGLKNSGLPRPHYEMPEELVYRAVSGEVLFHFTHTDGGTRGPQAIHSEPNPCPDRHLFVFDWNNIVRRAPEGAYEKSVEVPEETIINSLRAFESYGTPEFLARLRGVAERARSLLPQAEKFPGACATLQELIGKLELALE